MPAPPPEPRHPGPSSLPNAWGGTSEGRGGEGLLGALGEGGPGAVLQREEGSRGAAEGGGGRGGWRPSLVLAR